MFSKFLPCFIFFGSTSIHKHFFPTHIQISFYAVLSRTALVDPKRYLSLCSQFSVVNMSFWQEKKTRAIASWNVLFVCWNQLRLYVGTPLQQHSNTVNSFIMSRRRSQFVIFASDSGQNLIQANARQILSVTSLLYLSNALIFRELTVVVMLNWKETGSENSRHFLTNFPP